MCYISCAASPDHCARLFDQLVPALLELLESEEAGEREGAVRALLLVAAPPALLPPLRHLAAADPDGRVRAAAEGGLAEMGADGRAALQEVSPTAGRAKRGTTW